jgi:quinol monooxygenase YgiN
MNTNVTETAMRLSETAELISSRNFLREHLFSRREMIFGGLASVTLGYTKQREPMSNKLTLVVRFRIPESQKQELLTNLRAVFTHIVKEETFVEASLVEDMRDPESILNYEVWNETPESFMKSQMSKAYRADFEKMIVDLKIERTPAWYSTIVDWKKA